jgi:hypothetical protein
MSNRNKRTRNELERLRLPELQARFREVVGETSRSPNRKFLIRRIEETLAARAEQPAAPESPPPAVDTPAEESAASNASLATPTHVRGRFTSMSIEELQAKYLEAVGRATGSNDRRYVELANMWSRGSARRVLPRRASRSTPHNRVAFSGGMTLRFPRSEACMATSAGSWRSQGERA